MTTYAISAANGQLGRLALEQLRLRVTDNDQIIALVRNPEKAGDLGVTVRAADYANPTQLEQALQGVDKLYMISGSEVGKRVEQHRNVIAAAKKAGVKHIVYTSVLNAENSPLSLAPDHVATEQAIKESGLDYTILRHGWYTENYTESMPAILEHSTLFGSAGDGKIASATRADLAEAGMIVLTSDAHRNQTYELAGDQAYTLTELAAEIARQAGKAIAYANLSVAEYAELLEKVGLPAEIAKAVADWDFDASKGALFSTDRTLSQLLNRPTTSLADAVKAML